MLDIFLIIILIIALPLLGSLLYLFYLPFKNWLLKSGRLTYKLSRQIDRAYIISLCVLGIVLYYLNDYRKPSKTDLEETSGIHLPSDFKVIKDEYSDNILDYSILYVIQFKGSSMPELIKGIKTSKFYNPNVFHSESWIDSGYFIGGFIPPDSVKVAWTQYSNGYNFIRVSERLWEGIELDAMIYILKYSVLSK